MSASPQHQGKTTEFEPLPAYHTTLRMQATAPPPTLMRVAISKPIAHKILASDASVEGSAPSSPENSGTCAYNHHGNFCSLEILYGTPVAPCQCPTTCWSVESHRALVAQIFEVGLQKASPNVIMENMKEGSSSLSEKGITKEKIKSHLQKYRLGKERSKTDFMNEFDTWMKSAQGELVDRKRNHTQEIGRASCRERVYGLL